MITKEKAIDILDKIDFFQGQRAGRELWNEKPRYVQELDLKAFQEDVALLREYIADVVPRSEVDEIVRQWKEEANCWQNNYIAELRANEQINADHLLANGVIVLPCKVGSSVYQIDDARVYESAVEEITVTRINTIFCTECVAFDETAIGKSIFLSREEAEKALERSKQ